MAIQGPNSLSLVGAAQPSMDGDGHYGTSPQSITTQCHSPHSSPGPYEFPTAHQVVVTKSIKISTSSASSQTPLPGQADIEGQASPEQPTVPTKMPHSASKSSTEDIKNLVRATNKAMKRSGTSTWTPNTHQILIMATLSLVSLMVALDSCIIVTSLNTIIVDLELSTSGGIWIGTSYLLANAVTMPFLSELSNIFGRPVVLVFALCCFAIGTLLCCLAQDLSLLLAGRVIQGVGGAGIMSLSLIIFTDIVPLRWRPKWYGFVLGAWAVGNCTGPVIGGAIAQTTTWRWIFYLMFPLCFIGLALVLYLLKFRTPSATASQKVQRVDWTGGICFIASATILLVAISWGGSQFSWASTGTLIPLCLGLVGLLGTVVYEAKLALRPFLRRSLFHDASSVITYLCGTIQGFLIYGQLYYIPFYFQAVKGYHPLHTGIATLPVMVTCVPSSMVTGIIVTKTANYRWPIWLGWATLLLGSGLTIIFGKDTSTAAWAVILVIVGFGHGAILNAQNFASQAMCRPGEEGSAAAMYAFVRQFGMALGVGVGSSIFQNTMASKLLWEGLDDAIASRSEAFVGELWQMPIGDPTRTMILDAYVYGIRSIYMFFACMAAFAFVLSLFSKQCYMREEVDTEHVLEGMGFELA